MKPSFALNFSDDAIGLLHRTSRGWLEVGTVALDEPDLAQALTYLRGSALGLEPRGITTKLVIPNSQIRYITLPAAGPDAASRRAQIKVGLEGRTPYAVDDLVFDWWGKGPTVQVAVVARETLAEAEAFAAENRLNPLSFVAIPEPGSFGAEPWFGPSSMAATLLASGEKVDRDQDPIQIVGRMPKAEAAAEPAEADAAAAAEAEVTETADPMATPDTPPEADTPEPQPAEPQPSEPQPAESRTPDIQMAEAAPTRDAPTTPQQPDPPAAGVIAGTIVDDLPAPPAQPEQTAEPATARITPSRCDRPRSATPGAHIVFFGRR